MNVITRFAPSPTGNLHIGGARTAIFNYLYAKKMKGKFYLRIEDTDAFRSKKEFEDEIIKSMAWLGMDFDGELMYQSQRTDIYKSYISRLIDSGNAYLCDCTPSQLEEQRELATSKKLSTNYTKKCRNLNKTSGVIRFKIPQAGETVIDDLILGKIVIKHEQIEDFVIARADGSPTYNFTVVVDDYEMGISHVIRGDDHVNNTPKQLLLFKALGLNPPMYAHVPMILGPDGKKLSKRHGATAVSQYKADGYLPEALFNYLVRLSWSHKDQEIFSISELENIFDISQVGKSSAMLSVEKLDWLNSHYIKNKYAKDLADLLSKNNFINKDNSKLYLDPTLKLIDLVKERAKTLLELANGISYILEDDICYDTLSYKKYFTDDLKVVFEELIFKLSSLENFNAQSIEAIYKMIIEKYNFKMKKIAQASRVLLTGTDKSPGIFEIIFIFGKDLSLKRLGNFHLFLGD